MATSFSNNAEGGTNGTALTTSDTTGGDAFSLVNAPSGGSITYSTDDPAHGTACYKLVSTANNASQVGKTMDASDYYAVRYLLKLPAVPSTSSLEIGRMYASATKVFALQINTSGKINTFDASGSVVDQSSATITEPQHLRIEYVLIKGTTTSNGTILVGVYPKDSDTAIYTYTANGTANTGTAQFTQPRFGDTAGVNWAATMYIDDVRVEAQTTFIGKVSTLPDPEDTVTPYATTANDGGWTIEGSQSTIEETLSTEDDDDYITTPDGSPDLTVEPRLAPITAAPAVITVRGRTPTAPASMKFALMLGDTEVTSTAVTALTTDWLDYDLTLDSTAQAAVTGHESEIDILVTGNPSS